MGNFIILSLVAIGYSLYIAQRVPLRFGKNGGPYTVRILGKTRKSLPTPKLS